MSDSVANARLWHLVPVSVLACASVTLLLSPYVSEQNMTTIQHLAIWASIVCWWLLGVGREKRGTNCHSPLLKGTEAVRLTGLLVVCNLAVTMGWVVLRGFFGVKSLGLTAPPVEPLTHYSAQALVFDLVKIGVIVPIVEEVIFRSMFFRKLRLRVSAGKAAIVMSVLFGLGHMDVPRGVFFGICFTVLYTATRSLWFPIVAHGLNNTIGVVSYHAKVFFSETQFSIFINILNRWETQCFLFGFGVFSAIWLVRFLLRFWPTLQEPYLASYRFGEESS